MFNVVDNQFQKFYDFAQASKTARKDTAIAKIDDGVAASQSAELISR